MKKRHIIVGLLYLFFLTSVVGSFAVPSKATHVGKPLIDADCLGYIVGNFVDGTTGDGSGKINHGEGGNDLVSFENLGIYSKNTQTGKVIYWARAKYGFEISSWTSATFRDNYPNINLNGEGSSKYFEIHWYRDNQPTNEGSTKFYARWKQVETGNLHRHDYDGYFPIQVYFKDLQRYSGRLSVGGVEFDVPSLTTDITQVKVLKHEKGKVGEYRDEYVDATGVSECTLTMMSLDPSRTSSDVGLVMDFINSYEIGWKTPIDPHLLRPIDVQQAVIDPAIGVLSDQNPSIKETWDCKLNIQLQPRVTKRVQPLKIKAATVIYDQSYWVPPYEWLRAIESPHTDVFERTISIHTHNMVVKHWIEVRADFFITVQFSPELSSSELEKVGLWLSDMVWDTSMYGDIDPIIILPIPSSWEDLLNTILGYIILILFIIGIAFIFFKVAVPYLMVRKKIKKTKDSFSLTR